MIMTKSKPKIQKVHKRCSYRSLVAYANSRLFLITPKSWIKGWIMEEDRDRFSNPVEVELHHSDVETGRVYVRELERGIVYSVDSTMLVPMCHLTKKERAAAKHRNKEGVQVTVEMIKEKLDNNCFRINPDHPIGLHAWPKRNSDCFCAIGNIIWGKDAKSIGDVYVGRDRQHYHKINQMLRQACEELGYKFISMS